MTKYAYRNEELIRLAREGDIAAEEELFRVNDNFCHKLAQKFSNTNIEYDDLLSLARMGLFKAYRSFNFDNNNKFLTFAVIVMNNEILLQIRKNKKHKETFNLEHIVSTDYEGNELHLIDVIPNPEDIDVDTKLLLLDTLKKFLEIAKESDKIVLKRCILDGESQKEVANDLKISQSYVSRKVTAIEKKLKNIMENGKLLKNSPTISNNKEIIKLKHDNIIYIFTYYKQLSNGEIARIIGISPQTVKKYRKLFYENSLDNIKPNLPDNLKAKFNDFFEKNMHRLNSTIDGNILD